MRELTISMWQDEFARAIRRDVEDRTHFTVLSDTIVQPHRRHDGWLCLIGGKDLYQLMRFDRDNSIQRPIDQNQRLKIRNVPTLILSEPYFLHFVRDGGTLRIEL